MDVYKIKIYPTAKKDLQEIIDYLNTLSQQAALRYYDLLIAEIESLSQMPFRCPKPRDIALAAKGYRYLIVESYLVFGGMENRIAAIVFGVPAVKGVEFGEGFGAARLRGSENNDGFCVRDGKISTLTNHCGGILGGITNGMPLRFRAAVKPTPSIFQPQRSVNLETMEETTLQIQGRHDPCIVPRAVPVMEAAAAIAIYDALLGYQTERM